MIAHIVVAIALIGLIVTLIVLCSGRAQSRYESAFREHFAKRAERRREEE